MAPFTTRAAVSGLAAAAALLASPAAAAQPANLPTSPPLAASVAQALSTARAAGVQDVFNQWGCWDCGYGRGWNGRGWRRRGPSTGEVLAGVAIIGGIAAIAAAASNDRRNRDVVVVERDRPRDWDRRDDRLRYDNRRSDPRRAVAGGLESAANQCVNAIEQSARVNDVTSVQRTAQGWLVTGALANGALFDCRIGNDGRIEAIDYGAPGALGAGNGTQWDDARYAEARSRSVPGLPIPGGPIERFDPGTFAGDPARAPGFANGQQPLVPLTAPRLPAYPGGPIPGEKPAPLVQRPGIP